ncbi:MAG TPA: family 20 glycosylhydrolase [Streptosporangiaceae bacterium]|nr:family 20 glycosylhydrolase [Streptosporangiaceae bacterium]
MVTRTPIIPAPARITPAVGEFRLVPGATIGYHGPMLAPLARRFSQDLARRCGLPLRSVQAETRQGEAASEAPSEASSEGPSPGDGGHAIVVSLGDDADLDRLPAPLGLHPAGTARDERYLLAIDRAGIRLRAPEPAGLARGLTTLLQLIATTAAAGPAAAGPAPVGGKLADGAVPLAALRILDGPRFAWRGLTVDVVRRFFPPAQIRTLIDLAALYKLDVLHLHLTDDQGWRIEAGRPASLREPDGSFYTNDELRTLESYAADRFVTLLPEVDTPGHVLALLRLRPELSSGRNLVHRSAWLDPDLPTTFPLMGQVLADLASLFPGPFLHIGGDEPFGMPDRAYGDYIRRLKGAVRSLGKQTVGWQESIRAGADPGHVVQYWMDASSLGAGAELPPPPEVTARVRANYQRGRADIEHALAHGVPVIVSPQAHCYFDVPYAEAAADPGQRERRDQVGLRHYARQTLEATFDWDPVTTLGADQVAGVGAALWCETVRDVDDLTFLLLPRLAGTAEKAWGPAGAIAWPEHRDSLAQHTRLWEQDGLTFFSAA